MTNSQPSKQSLLDLVGIGNSIVDILVKTEDEFLTNHQLKKGSMCLIDEDQASKLYESCISDQKISGGSAANTIAGFAMLGGKAGFIGRVKNDSLGETFTNEIREIGVIYETPPAEIGYPTAQCFVFVTPDAERTMCTFLGASTQLDPEDIDLSIVKQAKVLYLEGYLWDSPPAKKAFLSAAQAAKDAGKKVALSLSDAFCVERHRESFLELIEKHIDILFANQSEIMSLYQTSEFEEAIQKVKGKAKIVILTSGEKGSIILSEEKFLKIPAYKFGELIDTTGAGDLYASGFLYGFTQNKSLEECGRMGSICAGQIVTQLGPRSEIPLKKLLTEQLA